MQLTRLLRSAACVAATLAVGLTACTSGQIGVEPTARTVDVAGMTVLQFAVGTATFNATGNTVLNTVVTYRQPNGLAGTLYNTPMLTGPAGFTVPAAASAGTDAGTNHISGTAPTQPGVPALATTFGQSGGAYAYGFAPSNANTLGAPSYPNTIGVGNGAAFGCAFCGGVAPFGALFSVYTQPLYQPSSTRLPFLLGPPAVPEFHDGTFPTGFLGYPSGFVAFATAPVAGQYTLTVTVPGGSPGAAPIAVKTVNATLTSTGGLPQITTPVTATTTGGGGASFVVAPRPTGTTNQLLYIADLTAAGNLTLYTFDATAGGAFVLDVTNGPKNAQGVRQPPLGDGDEILAYVVASDYDILALGPPGNTMQAPALPAQADITVSAPLDTLYVGAAPPGTPLAFRRAAH